MGSAVTNDDAGAVGMTDLGALGTGR